MPYRSTSRAAWHAHDPGPINRRILQALEAAGAQGLTCDEIEVKLGLDHQTASANISHLKNGTQRMPILIEGTGVKVPTRSGRKAERLRVKPAAGAQGDLFRIATAPRPPRAIRPTIMKSGAPLTAMASTILTFIEREACTCERLELKLGLAHQTASARLRELYLKGRIEDSGSRDKTLSRRKAIVWRPTGYQGATP